jgi:threonine aldolase
MIDLRSDTVTKPTPAMRRAIAEAEVGDDVFGEDPTARRLEARVAELLGKEAALFVPTGVMGNQLAIKVWTRPGDEVVVAERSHIFHYESGAPGLLSGVQLRPVDEPRGLLSGEAVAAVVRGRYDWEPRTRLVCLENTVNKAGGVVYPLALLHDVAEAARAHSLALHLDGARLWNAAVASGHSEAEIAAPFDTVTVCLSKGLGAPVGSMLAGSEEAIRLARRYRKLFGGGMRQIGILAEAGLYALDHHRAGLADDHARARRLADALAALPTFTIDPAAVETNIVIAETGPPAEDVLARLDARGVRLVAFGPHTVRATLHRDVSDADVDTAIAVLHEAFGAEESRPL